MSTNNEQYETIPGFGMRYQINSFGRIIDTQTNAEVPHKINSNGYHWVTLYNEMGVAIQNKVHLHLLLTFKPNEKPKGKLMGFYKDGNPDNLHISNIGWGHAKTYQAEMRRIEMEQSKQRTIYCHAYCQCVCVYLNFQSVLDNAEYFGDDFNEEVLKDALSKGTRVNNKFVFSFEDLTLKYKAKADAISQKLTQKKLQL